MSQIAVGQRYMSETEPELGLGMVVEFDSKTISVVFPGSEISRKYGIKSAPLKRVIFNLGDEITSITGDKAKILQITECDGIYTYSVDGDFVILESNISGTINFNRPEERFFHGQFDSNDLFNLRYETLKHQKRIFSSRVRGLSGGRIDLIPHQIYLADEICKRIAPRVLLADEVGLGKTIEAGLVLHQLIISGRVERVLIVLPDSLVYQWFVEMLRRFQLSFVVLNQEVYLEKGTNPFEENQLVITNIGLLRGSAMAREMVTSAKWDIMVVDEAHQLRWSPDESSSEYQIVSELAKEIPGLVLLTATPEQLGVEGHFARLRLLDPDRFHHLEEFIKETSEYGFIAEIAGKIIQGGKLSDLEQTFLDKINDDQEEDVLKALLDRHGTGRVFFRNTRDNMVNEFDFFPKRILFPYPVKNEKDKILWFLNFIREHFEEKILLICHSKKKIISLEREIKRSVVNIKTSIFHSGLSLMARDRQIAYFADPEGAQILLCTEEGSEGRNFEFVSHLVLFDLPKIPDLLEQRIGRLDRIGQKRDVNIHVPYLSNGPEEIIFRWYHESCDAFLTSSKSANHLMNKMKNKLQEILDNPQEYMKEEKIGLINFLKEATLARLEIDKKLEQGRDFLIEMNSFNKSVADQLIAEIKEPSLILELENYMDEIFHHLGVDMTEIDSKSFYLKPGDNMFVPHFPGLSRDGLSATFDRTKALKREDIAFLTWDHPMVIGVMDLVLSNQFGNVTVSTWKNSQTVKVLLEAIYVLKCVAPPKLEVNRFFPPTVVRVLIDEKGKDFSEKYTKEMMDEKLISLGPEKLATVKSITKDWFSKLIKESNNVVDKVIDQYKTRYLDDMKSYFNNEITRLNKLSVKNKTISQNEINMLEDRRDALFEIMKNSEVYMDSFRFIF